MSHPIRRAADNGTVSRISVLYDRYKFLVPIIVTVLVALGFGFKTPKAHMDDIRDEIHHNRDWTEAVFDTLVRQNKERSEREKVMLSFDSLSALDLCLRRRSDPYVYTRLNCKAIVNGSGELR